MSAKKYECSKVVGFVGGSNTRNRIPGLTDQGCVMFDSELERDEEGKVKEEDTRKVLYNMVYGDKADEKSQNKLLALVKEHESDGPDSIWGLAHSFLKFGQKQPCEVQAGDDGYLLVDGFGRWFANIVAHLISPTTYEDKFLAEFSDITDINESKALSVQLNTSHRGLKPSEEAKVYYDIKKTTGKSAKEIAVLLNVFDRKGKPNVARVHNYLNIFNSAVTDQDRLKLDAGQTTVDKIMNKAKEAKERERQKTGKKKASGRPRKSPKALSYEELMKVYSSDKLIDYFSKEKEDDFENYGDAIRFGLKIAMGKEKLPTEQEISAMLDLEEAVVG